MQLADKHADQLTQMQSVTAGDDSQVIQVGSMLAVTDRPGEANRPRTAHVDIRYESLQVIESEEWKLGDPVYWHSASSTLTTAAVGPFFGWADYNGTAPADGIVKAAGDKCGYVATKAATVVDGGGVMDYVFDFARFPTLAVQSVYAILVPPAGRWVSKVEFAHDGNLAPVTPTLEIGSAADPDALLTATALSALIALGSAHVPRDVSATVAQVDDIQLTIGVADITAGQFLLRFHLSPV